MSNCRCRVKSYLKVTLSPSRTVMLSGTCPNSAPCKLVPVKKEKKKIHMSNSWINSPPPLFYWIIFYFLSSFLNEGNIRLKEGVRVSTPNPHSEIMISFLAAFWWSTHSLNTIDIEPRDEDAELLKHEMKGQQWKQKGCLNYLPTDADILRSEQT